MLQEFLDNDLLRDFLFFKKKGGEAADFHGDTDHCWPSKIQFIYLKCMKHPKVSYRKFSQPGCDVIHQLGFFHIDAQWFSLSILKLVGEITKHIGFYAD